MDPEIALLMLHAAYLDPKEAAAKAQNLWLANPHRTKGEQEVLHHILHTWWKCCEDPIAMLHWLSKVIQEEESGMRWLAGLCCAIYRTMPETASGPDSTLWFKAQENEILRELNAWAEGGPHIDGIWPSVVRENHHQPPYVHFERATALESLVRTGFTEAELGNVWLPRLCGTDRPSRESYAETVCSTVCTVVAEHEGSLFKEPDWFRRRERHGIKLSDLIRKYLLEHPKSGLLPEDA